MIWVCFGTWALYVIEGDTNGGQWTESGEKMGISPGQRPQIYSQRNLKMVSNEEGYVAWMT